MNACMHAQSACICITAVCTAILLSTFIATLDPACLAAALLHRILSTGWALAVGYLLAAVGMVTSKYGTKQRQQAGHDCRKILPRNGRCLMFKLKPFLACRPRVYPLCASCRPLRTVRPCIRADLQCSRPLGTSALHVIVAAAEKLADELVLLCSFALDTVTQENYIRVPSEGEQLKWHQNPVHPFCIAANVLW
jgi:predicted signal transduction protein with EAL and GGDEF domain